MGCQEKVKVQKLHTDEAWNLFKQKLGQDMALAPEVEEIAKSMGRVCDGLPLGIIVLARSMKGETSIHVWRNELEKLRDPNMVQDEEDEVFKVLKYSFDRLDFNHQLCFLCCWFYPEDFRINKGQLVDRFISEELVDKRKSRQSQLDQCHSVLNKLVKICLLESVDEDWVKMHDLMRAMALKITKQKYMVISKLCSLKEILNEGEWIKDLKKVSLMGSGIMEIPDGMLLNCPNLMTLILCLNPLKFIPNSFFSRLGNLCFLDLSETNIEKLPNSLSNLEKLKSLNLKYCQKLIDIPDLRKLKKLRELDLSGTAITKGSKQCDLKNEDLSVLLHDIQSLKLENCKGLSNSLLDDFPRFNKPSSLKVLEICHCREIECFLTNEPFLMANLESKSRFLPLKNLEEIELIGLQNFIGLSQNIGVAIEPPLPQATVFSSLRFLYICGRNKMRKLGLPSSALKKLEEIWIERCNEIEEILQIQEGEGRVVSLPKLKVLSLWNLP